MMAETRYDVPFPVPPQNTVLTGPCVSNTAPEAEIFVPDWQAVDRNIVLMALMVLHRHLLMDYSSMDPEIRATLTDRTMMLIQACAPQ